MNRMTKPRVIAVIPAAGVGSRMQADRPKQYLTIAGKTILEHTLDALLAHCDIDRVVLAVSPDDAYLPTLKLTSNERVSVVQGGKERADSVLNGIKALHDDEWALVHDAARPCVSQDDISALLNVINDSTVTGGILATPVRDTMKRAASNQECSTSPANSSLSVVSHTESRANLWHALTPQLFPATLLLNALKEGLSNGVEITDEASAMEYAGYKVGMVNGSPANIKITHPADLPLAEFYLHQKLKAPFACE